MYNSERYFSDWLQGFLVAHGIDTFVFNPGASFRGLHDSLVNSNDSRLIMTCHEEIAVSFAHGYYKASGRIIAVILHANVGLLHGSMAIFNAWCDRVPLLCFVGNGPLAAGDRRPWIDWIHTAHDILSPVRGYTVFSAISTDQWGTAHDVRRALRIVLSENNLGPSVIALDSAVQESPVEPQVENFSHININKNAIFVEDSLIHDVAEKLANAKRPLILVERAGRQNGLMQSIERLAEALKVKIPVIECGYYENAISSVRREEWCRIEEVSAENAPDLVISLDTIDPLSHINRIISSEKEILDNLFISVNTPGVPLSGWSADTAIDSPGQILVGDVVEFLDRLSKYTSPSVRFQKFITKKSRTPSELSNAVKAIHDVLVKSAVDYLVVNGGSTGIDQAIRSTFSFHRESQFLGMNGGGGLGYGLPASLGAALALYDDQKNILPISFLGDGDFLYTPSSLWTAAAKCIPILLVVVNNGQYLNSVEHAKIISENRGRKTSPRTATTFDEASVDFAELANSFGVTSANATASNIKEVSNTVLKAISYIRINSAPFLINLRVEK